MITIVVLGEKDHGKSTLIGRLIFETKSLPDDRMWNVKKAMKGRGQKFEWAHLLDSFRYEREREMTLDTTRAIVKLGEKIFEFIDVPGHKELIKNMLTGAGDAKFAILVIDVSEGIKPQTLKHLEIADFLGIKKFIIAVNKLDKIKYSRIKYEEMLKDFSLVLSEHSLGKKQIFIPISAFTGNNLLKKTTRLKWFRGPTLAQTIQQIFIASAMGKPKHGANRTKHIEPVCLFIEKPAGNISIESGHKNFPISKLSGFKKIHELKRVSIEFNKIASLKNNFVIKRKSKIIGICK